MKRAEQQGLSEFEETLQNRQKNREKQGRPKTKEIHQQLTRSAHCAEGTVIPEMVFPATQGAAREPPIRVQHLSFSRLKVANLKINLVKVKHSKAAVYKCCVLHAAVDRA